MQLTRGEGTEEELAMRREKALADPEIQNIMTDPIMRQVTLATPRFSPHTMWA
jgi:hypothetical protein